MKIQQKRFSHARSWEIVRNNFSENETCHFVLAFGSTENFSEPAVYDSLRAAYPSAEIILNSTAGEISDTQVSDNSISVTAIHFEKTKIKTVAIQIEDTTNSFDAGVALCQKLDHSALKYVLVISDGLKVNGSELVLGLQHCLPAGTFITGGLAGDGARFEKTLVGLNEAPSEGKVVAVGFYGDALEIKFSSVGGWDSFGPERLITKSKKNILFELDGKPALDIYKLYLGEYAKDLPGSGLLFPLSIRTNNETHSLVRTILAMNEDDKSLTFAGNMPEGSFARLMKANFDRLIDGATCAAQNTLQSNDSSPEFALLISCVGRKLVLNQRIEEEVEEIRAVFGNDTALAGFYSYGEISPGFNFTKCELHNQTMTVTTLTERTTHE